MQEKKKGILCCVFAFRMMKFYLTVCRVNFDLLLSFNCNTVFMFPAVA